MPFCMSPVMAPVSTTKSRPMSAEPLGRCAALSAPAPNSPTLPTSSLSLANLTLSQNRQATYARLRGNATQTWFDAALSPAGHAQASTLRSFWLASLSSTSETPVSPPHRHLTSPLQRCLETARLTYADLPLPADRPFRPVVVEALRERLGVHTCDARHSRGWIEQKFPEVIFEEGFTEEDGLWREDKRETIEEMVKRLRSGVDVLFESLEKGETFIALTMHSGSVRALYDLLGHREVWVAAGALVPVFVKAERVVKWQVGM